ncbi:pyruvate, phosphate dikinase/phosphoenolpyruvate synthase regulator [Lyticum sinuosum]|uniref:Pyruvate, phosphate dikinase regulatory protein n=1 Tax=Lyticum sinuosum TaxID=1332059 RepID=A0AAE5AHZ4_9RICK|nr:pyruvate, phosphate dikinase/phosphoenolpyruvate synthase regulator [Lyticum sinuosum]MDZ5761374.1 putative pyruvate, phosphate dikinase regulatory protein [Lyticum sinuosum]
MENSILNYEIKNSEINKLYNNTNTNKKKLLMYLVSDASGETVNTVSEASLSQFSGIEIEKRIRPLTRTITQIDEIIFEIKKEVNSFDQRLILYTMTDSPSLDHLIKQCKINNISYICPIDPITQKISELLRITPNINYPSKYHINQDYYKIIDNINFAIHHDDGQNRQNYNKADIVIIGTSRSSKSPTSLYLSRHGYKVANIPYFPDIEPDISDLDEVIKIGLIISPSVLTNIREKRSEYLSNSENVCKNDIYKKYISITQSREEIVKAIQFFRFHNIPIVDITRKAIEEISAEIINIVRKINKF